MRAVVALACYLAAFPAWSADCVSPPAGLIGWWRGEGNGNDGAGTNNAYALSKVSFTNGIVGQAFAFDPENYPYGTYTGVRIADQPSYALTNSLSIEAWIRPRGDGWVVLHRGDRRSGQDPYVMTMEQNNTLDFWVEDSNQARAGVSVPLIYNQWWYVVGTLDDASGKLSLYTNGTLAAQITTAIRPFGALIPQDSPGIGIGNVNDGFNNFPFHGDIDEISLYNRALSATEIQATYQASRVGKCQEPPSILVQVADLTVTGTSPATFTVTAAGTPQLRYQWRFNGADITGATDTSLTLANVQVSNAGSYSVRVVNAFGSVISSNALLTVILPCVPAPANLVGWWRGEGNALDQVGGNSGVLLNGAGFDAGVVG
ncbi:MAG: immunoglobulin domain-containing protein, partial [Verrucomicrobia bacterium]|nr:immunoglobulin domain-containing protein [Verrucomicrobiota bacterium]